MSSAYTAELAAARQFTEQDEAVVTGKGTLWGRRVAFLASAIEVATAECLVTSIKRATSEVLPSQRGRRRP